FSPSKAWTSPAASVTSMSARTETPLNDLPMPRVSITAATPSKPLFMPDPPRSRQVVTPPWRHALACFGPSILPRILPRQCEFGARPRHIVMATRLGPGHNPGGYCNGQVGLPPLRPPASPPADSRSGLQDRLGDREVVLEAPARLQPG